jgi:ribonuclease P protein component
LVVRSSAKEVSFAEMARAFEGVTRKLQRQFPASPGGASP